MEVNILNNIKAGGYAFGRWFRFAKQDILLVWRTSKTLRKTDRWVRNTIPGGWGFIIAVLLAIAIFLIIDSIGILGLLMILFFNTHIIAGLIILAILIPQIIPECR